MTSGDDLTRRPDSDRPSRSRRRQVVAFAIGALVALFAVLNLDDVEVHWIVGTRQTPLIVVIGVSVVLGAGIGWMLGRRRA